MICMITKSIHTSLIVSKTFYFLGSECSDEDVKQLPGKLIDMACNACEIYLGRMEHKDIDTAVNSSATLNEEEWNELVEQYYSLIQ